MLGIGLAVAAAMTFAALAHAVLGSQITLY
jgi:hypothetical protein